MVLQLAIQVLERKEDVDAVGEMIYNALCRYFNVLEKTGYMAINNALKLLVLIFYKDFVYSDYRCTITKDDYRLIERALDCLYGTTCLIPYPDYLKMGKLHLSEVSELACRIKALEDEKVVKVIHNLDSVKEDIYSDVMVIMDGEEEENSSSPTPGHDTPDNNNEQTPNQDKPSADGPGSSSGEEHEGRNDEGNTATIPTGNISDSIVTPSYPPGWGTGGHDL